MKAKKTLFIALAVAATLASCHNKTNGSATDSDSTATDSTAAIVNEKDSTIYGKATDDFGMSTFSMVTEKGDTLYLSRTANDGSDGKIYGPMVPSDRYAVTTCDSNQSIKVLINVTELEKKVKDYKLVNGHLIVDGNVADPAKYFD